MSRKSDDTTGLSRLFHLNSAPWVNERPDVTAPYARQAKSDPDAVRIPLPVTRPGPSADRAAMRRSVRAFDPNPLALADLAALLRAGYGALGPDPMGDGQRMLRRPVPSAGGLYPLELYALVRNVEGLAQGIYHYDVIGDALEVVSKGAWEQLAKDAFISWPFVEPAPVILCLGAVFDRTQDKYGPRGYRYVLLEAGHVAQNLCLAAADLNLSSLCLGGFHDAHLNRMIALDGMQKAAVYAVALGAAAAD